MNFFSSHTLSCERWLQFINVAITLKTANALIRNQWGDTSWKYCLFIDRYNLLGYDAAIQVPNIASTCGWLCMPDGFFQRRRQSLGIKRTNAASLCRANNLRHITDIRS